MATDRRYVERTNPRCIGIFLTTLSTGRARLCSHWWVSAVPTSTSAAALLLGWLSSLWRGTVEMSSAKS